MLLLSIVFAGCIASHSIAVRNASQADVTEARVIWGNYVTRVGFLGTGGGGKLEYDPPERFPQVAVVEWVDSNGGLHSETVDVISVVGSKPALREIDLLFVITDSGVEVSIEESPFAEGDVIAGPMLLPPMVKIYQDGQIVFLKDDGVWHGHVAPRRLSKLKKKLANHKLLKETGLVQVRKGASPGFHGGVAYIRYLEGEEEVVLGALLLPSSGPWRRLVSTIRDCIPSIYSRFVLKQISVRVHEGGLQQIIAADQTGRFAHGLAAEFQHSLAAQTCRADRRGISASAAGDIRHNRCRS